MRVLVELVQPDGSVWREATYEAPDDVEVGALGLVQYGGEYPRMCIGRVASLTPTYDGPCKRFDWYRVLAIRSPLEDPAP